MGKFQAGQSPIFKIGLFAFAHCVYVYYIDVAQTIFVILAMTGFFLDSHRRSIWGLRCEESIPKTRLMEQLVNMQDKTVS